MSITFEDAIMELFLPRLDTIQHAVQCVVGESFNALAGEASMKIVRKAHRLEEIAAPLIKSAMNHARPGLVGILNSMPSHARDLIDKWH